MSKPPQPLCNSVRGGDEVDQFLDTPAKGRLDIRVRAHPPENLLPPFGDIRLRLGGESECPERADLDVCALGNVGPFLKPHSCGFHGLPHIDVWVTEDENVLTHPRLAHDALGDAGFLGPRNEMINEDPEPAAWTRPECPNALEKVIGAIEHFDSYAFDAQVVPPHLLHEFRIVLAFNPNPGTARDAGTGSFDIGRA